MITRRSWNTNQVNNAYELAVTGVDNKDLEVSKVHKENSCSKCSKRLASGVWVVGRHYRKICMDCSPIYYKERLDSLDSVKQKIESQIKFIEDNQDKIKSENMMANLK